MDASGAKGPALRPVRASAPGDAPTVPAQGDEESDLPD